MNGQVRVLMLSDIDNPHTQRWVKFLTDAGIRIHLFGFGVYNPENYRGYGHVEITSLGLKNDFVAGYRQRFRKWRYLLALPRVRAIIRSFRPHILHAHFATSYGLLGALCGFHPFILTVWGSDILVFPEKSRFFRWLVKFNCSRADLVTAAGHALARQTGLYTDKKISVVPFGIDLSVFKQAAAPPVFPGKNVVVGTIRNIRRVYGIDYLIRAFAEIRRRRPGLPLKLLIVGSGYPEVEQELQALVRKEQLDNDVRFWGAAPYSDIVPLYNALDIYVNVSLSESFGVAVLEASACGKPVIVSDVGGLPEVVASGETGLVVPSRDVGRTADAIEKLADNETLRQSMGIKGRSRVESLFDLAVNTRQLIDLYRNLL